jgi:NAD(P)-dependent dehydrogenase (short-subunit alcohol dehydrogenase family)
MKIPTLPEGFCFCSLPAFRFGCPAGNRAKRHSGNVVCPAVIETPMGERLWGAPAAKKFALSLHPIGRFGRPQEIADAVVWICSDAASFMAGQSLVLDGGFLAGPLSPS